MEGGGLPAPSPVYEGANEGFQAVIRVQIRQMTGPERKALERMLAGSRRLFELRTPGQWLGAVLLLALFALLGFAAGTLLALLFYLLGKLAAPLAVLGSPDAVRVLQPLGALAGLAGIPLWFKYSSQKALKTRAVKISKDLAQGVVEIVHVESRTALTQAQDSGEPAFFIETEKGKALFLNGDYLAGPVSDGKFPSTVFEIVRGPESRIILALHCLGEPFEAQSAIPDSGTRTLPADGEWIDRHLPPLRGAIQK